MRCYCNRKPTLERLPETGTGVEKSSFKSTQNTGVSTYRIILYLTDQTQYIIDQCEYGKIEHPTQVCSKRSSVLDEWNPYATV